MPNLLQQLENNEVVLMMYLADELSGEDRAEVEQLLATDGGLRNELTDLRKAWDVAFEGVDRHNRVQRSVINEASAIRTVSRLMRQRLIENLARPTEVPQVTKRAIPRWALTSAAAIVLLLSYIVWWGFRGDEAVRGSGGTTIVENDAPQEQPATLNGLMAEQTADELRQDWTGSDDTMEVLTRPLSEAEVFLAMLGDDSVLPGQDFGGQFLDKADMQ